MPAPVRSFVFDLGNVLVTFDSSRFYDRLREAGAQFDAAAETGHSALCHSYESGELDDGGFVSVSMRQLHFHGDPEIFRACWRDIFELNSPMESVLQNLHRRGFPLFVLSNTNNLHLAYLRERFPFFTRFTGGVYSHLAGTMKPDELIFRDLISQCGLAPEESLYIDDRAENIATGRRLGFQTHCYHPTSHSLFEELLQSTGIEL
ncbi:MAG TPA: HAD family phosphatase [Verrucomicrobiales bacterium]|nr:HAD family phosphatase [Verrucomicrobiales bacterium]